MIAVVPHLMWLTLKFTAKYIYITLDIQPESIHTNIQTFLSAVTSPPQLHIQLYVNSQSVVYAVQRSKHYGKLHSLTQVYVTALWRWGESGFSLLSLNLVPLEGTLRCWGGCTCCCGLECATGEDALRELLLRFLEACTSAAVMRVNLKTATTMTQK